MSLPKLSAEKIYGLLPTFVFLQWCASEAASCPRHKTLNEDINFGLHLTAPLQKHFVACSWDSSVIGQRVIHRQAVKFKVQVVVVGQETQLRLFINFVSRLSLRPNCLQAKKFSTVIKLSAWPLIFLVPLISIINPITPQSMPKSRENIRYELS